MRLLQADTRLHYWRKLVGLPDRNHLPKTLVNNTLVQWQDSHKNQYPVPSLILALLHHNTVTNVDQICNWSAISFSFAGAVHVSNRWLLAQATANVPIPNFYAPLFLCSDYCDRWFEPRLASARLPSNGNILSWTVSHARSSDSCSGWLVWNQLPRVGVEA